MSVQKLYPNSVHENVQMARLPEGDVLLVDGKARPLDHEAALYLRERFPFTAPVPVLRRPASFGVGDRLGNACPGHIRVFKRYDISPVFAQQSVREITLTKRSFADVLDCATFAVFREDFQGGFGADGDHLKKLEDIQTVLDLGYTMITLDCSDHIKGDGGKAPISDAMRARYLEKGFELEEGLVIRFGQDELAGALHTYGEAIDFATQVWERFFADGKTRADLEISIDETATPTTPQEHFFVANELKLRGVKMATMAPRFCGEFQKGIDYIGDLNQFDREYREHAIIARHFGYKISVHSGSDKFSAFPSVGRHSRGVFHVKTAGTNWLEAVRVIALHDPKLYREVHRYALESFDEARQYYHVTTDLSKIPALDSLSDAELPSLFEQNDARQLIHITYGLILNNPKLRQRMFKLWDDAAEEYAQALDRHIGRHMQLLGVKEI